jgi:ABC-2 type transport system permease protein
MPADTTRPAAAGPGGVIHNIGYRAYDGPRLGHWHIVLALCWHSLRSAFGLGRGFKAKVVPVLTLVIMSLPAIVNAAAVALNPHQKQLVSYGAYAPQLRILVLLVFVAAQAPELVSRDLRSHTLPLYFARPIRRLDYPAAKLAGFVLACLVLVDVPLLLLYLGMVTQLHSGSAVWANTRHMLIGLVIGAAWAVLLAAIGLVLASLSGRRAFATGAVAIFLLLSFTLAHVLGQIGEQTTGHLARQTTGHLARHVAGHLVRSGATPPPLVGLSGLISPFTDLEGLRLWLGGTTAGALPASPGGYGPLYGLMFLVFLGAAVGGLIARYRKVGVA